MYKEKYGGHSAPQTPEQRAVKEGEKHKEGNGLVEKVKHLVGLDHKEREKTPEVK